MTFAVLGTHTVAEWVAWNAENAVVTDDGVVLASGSAPTYVDPVDLETTLDGVEWVDVAIDDCETVYVLSAAGTVARDDRSDGVLETFFELDTGTAVPRAVAVTDDTVYVAVEDGSLVALSRTTGARRSGIDAGAADAFANPVGMAADHTHAYVLDEQPGGGVVYRLDRSGAREQVIPDPSSPSPPSIPGPRDLALDEQGNLYVLSGADGGSSAPPRYRVDRFDRRVGAPSGFVRDADHIEVPAALAPSCLAVGGVDRLLLGPGPEADEPRTLVRYLPDSGTFERTTAFEGVCETLVLRQGTENRPPGLYVLGTAAGSSAGVSLTFFEERRTHSRSTDTGQFDARIVRRFDAGQAAVEWHRVELEFALTGAGTQVRLQYAATDDAVAVTDVEWRSVTRPNPKDTLLDDAQGRYLWVRVELVGTETTSPTVSACRVFLPRRSYLRYLPAVYREDPASAAFFEQFLSAFESVFVEIEAQIASLPSLLDIDGVDAAYLDWLEGWLALETDESWSESARRELLRSAPSLFKSRGTRLGLLALLEIYLRDVEPPEPDGLAWERARRHERELLDGLVEDGSLGTEGRDRRRDAHEALPTERQTESLLVLEAPDLDCIDTDDARETFRRLLPCPQCFVVLVAPFVDAERVGGVDRLVRAERPAHTVGRGVGLASWIELGGHSYLGINSTLPTGEFRLERSSLGRDSTLVALDGAERPDEEVASNGN